MVESINKESKSRGIEDIKTTRSDSKGESRSLGPRGGARAPMPPLDKPMDQFLRPSIEKENISEKVQSQDQLNIEDKTPHNLSMAG
jgi:hypothetical protein